MTYTLTEFDGLDLPLYNMEQEHGGEVESSLVPTLGGVYDPLNDEQKLQRLQTISLFGIYAMDEERKWTDHAGTVLTDHLGKPFVLLDPEQAFRELVDQAKSKLGVRGLLYRERHVDGALHCKQARLVKIGDKHEVKNQRKLAQLSMAFESAQPGWAAKDVTTVSSAVSAGTTRFTLHNRGTLATADGVLSVEATSHVNSLSVRSKMMDISYNEAILPGTTLVIDSGAATVRLDNSDTYYGFSLGGNHRARSWLWIPSGSNWFDVTVDAACTVTFSFQEQWL